MRYLALAALCISLVFSVAVLPTWGQTPRARTRPMAEPDYRNSETVKSGQLRRSEQNVSGTPYLLVDRESGSRFFVAPEDDGIDLDAFVGEEVEVRGYFSTTADGRRRNFLVTSIDAPWEQPHVRSAGARMVGLPREADREASRLDYQEPARLTRQTAQATQIEDLGPAPELYDEYWDDGLVDQWGPAPLRQSPAWNTREMFWARGEYLHWWPRGMQVPALVTTTGGGPLPARADAGVLGEPTTRILFGEEEINDHDMSGFRIRSGFWLDPTRSLGVEGEYFFLDQSGTEFFTSSPGNPVIARPFFDIRNGQENAQLIAFPGVMRGSLGIEATTKMQSAGGRFRVNLGEGSLDCLDPSYCNVSGMSGTSYRIDGLLGYRYFQLEDSIAITENATSLLSTPGSFHIRDHFETRNEFHGGDVGMTYEVLSGPWMLEMLVKVAVGNNRQIVRATGQTRITENNTTSTHPGGVLVQRSNQGEFSQNRFAMLPELGVNLGYHLTPNWRATVGYSLLYLGSVVRAGDQIDLDVNPDLFPPEVSPFSGPLRPQVLFRESDFWAHGLSVGLELRR